MGDTNLAFVLYQTLSWSTLTKAVWMIAYQDVYFPCCSWVLSWSHWNQRERLPCASVAFTILNCFSLLGIPRGVACAQSWLPELKVKQFCLSSFTKHSVCSSLGGPVQEVGVMLKANISSITRPYQNHAQAVISYVLFQRCETLYGQKLEESPSLQWSFHPIKTLTTRISLLRMWSHCRVPVMSFTRTALLFH